MNFPNSFSGPFLTPFQGTFGVVSGDIFEVIPGGDFGTVSGHSQGDLGAILERFREYVRGVFRTIRKHDSGYFAIDRAAATTENAITGGELPRNRT